jgi:hypothetical protein
MLGFTAALSPNRSLSVRAANAAYISQRPVEVPTLLPAELGLIYARSSPPLMVLPNHLSKG